MSRLLLVVLHGVNLNLLGERPSRHYGTLTLAELEALVRRKAEAAGFECVCRQTNHEGEFVELIHEYRRSASAVLVNPGAWTHYSYAIRDALEVVEAPVAEVHLSDVSAREEWRRFSVIRDVCAFTLSGLGPEGYLQAVDRLAELAGRQEEASERDGDFEEDAE